MHSTRLALLLLTCAGAIPAVAAGNGMTGVAGGNHHSYFLHEGTVYSTGEDFQKRTGPDSYIGGKLGRPIDEQVLPGADPASLVARSIYNPSIEPVRGLEGLEIVAVASGQNDGAAITASGELYMWGPNDHGQLGLGDLNARHEAARVPLPAGLAVRQVSIGNAHTLALMEDGSVYGWGLNRNGTLGLGEADRVLEPTRVDFGGAAIAAIATAQNTHSLFLDEDGRLHTCGRNAAGVLGLGHADNIVLRRPQAIPTEARFRAIGVGVRTSFAIDREGRLFGWGDGSKAHFARTQPDGSPDLSDLAEPTRLEAAPDDLERVAAGSRHTVVLDANGDVHTWGIHTTLSGQLGIGEPAVGEPGGIHGSIHSEAQKVDLGGAKAVAIDSMANNVFVLTADNRILAWGQTAHGRLGDRIDAAHAVETRSGKNRYLAYEPVEITLEGLRPLERGGSAASLRGD